MKENGKPLTRFVPKKGKICTGKELAEALAHVELSREEAIAWNKDLGKARKMVSRLEVIETK